MTFSFPNGSSGLYLALAATLIVGFLAMFAMMSMPARWRRPVVATCTFLAGAIYVAYYLWPKPQAFGPRDIPQNFSESVGSYLADSVNVAGTISTALTTFLLGLGIYSLVRIHGRKLLRMQKDWGFSLVLLISMVAIVIFGYWSYWQTKFGPDAVKLQLSSNWTWVNYTNDFLFDGLLQQMESAMFSIIAFYILSAAYRAFRIRSVEATILLASALIMMLSLMGAVEFIWNSHLPATGFAANFQITEIARWIRDTLQTPGIRALDFGIGLGALAMGLRLWLSLERGGVSA
ncbi:MAG TPA: hypothetical protein VGL56_11145 [Fimbriimonadaceae bacterium]|jgi:uncharacterized membrane protein (UPF0136 family)